MWEEGRVYGNTPAFLGGKALNSTDDLKQVDAVVFGVPWEGSVTWGDYTGCEMGPKVIRHASARYSGFIPEYDIDIFDYLKIGDLGDITIDPSNVEKTMQYIEDTANTVRQAGSFPVAIGGDHGIAYPLIKSLTNFVDGKVGIIQFDAHYDNKPIFGNDPYARCCPFARVYELDTVKTSSFVHFGIRGPRNVKASAELAREVGAKVYTINDVRRSRSWVELVKEAYAIASDGTKAVYVTVCSDVLDIAFNPGGPPDPGGLTSWELLSGLYQLGTYGIAGFDIVEIYPHQNSNNEAAHVASWAIQYMLGGLAEKKRNGLR